MDSADNARLEGIRTPNTFFSTSYSSARSIQISWQLSLAVSESDGLNCFKNFDITKLLM